MKVENIHVFSYTKTIKKSINSTLSNTNLFNKISKDAFIPTLNFKQKQKNNISKIKYITPKDIKKLKENNTPVIFLDFDGVMASMEKNPKTSKLYSPKKYSQIFAKAKNNNIPIFILTGRRCFDFEELNLLDGFKGNINIIGTYGNDFDIRLPKNQKTYDFLDFCKTIPNHNLETTEENNTIHAIYYPVSNLDKTNINNIARLAQFNITPENKYNASFYISWRTFNDNVRNNSELLISSDLYDDIANYIENTKTENNMLKLICKETNKEGYISETNFGNYVVDTLIKNTKSFNKKVNICKEQKACEISNNDIDLITKGTIIEEISKMYKQPCPIFFSDLFGINTADECGFESAQKNNGMGIAVIYNDKQKSEKAKRDKIIETKLTSANYKIKSYKNIPNILDKIVS